MLDRNHRQWRKRLKPLCQDRATEKIVTYTHSSQKSTKSVYQHRAEVGNLWKIVGGEVVPRRCSRMKTKINRSTNQSASVMTVDSEGEGTRSDRLGVFWRIHRPSSTSEQYIAANMPGRYFPRTVKICQRIMGIVDCPEAIQFLARKKGAVSLTDCLELESVARRRVQEHT